jgi:S-DNA-T family DNA segregation ATPase FtsK/SpoIIIE
MDIDGNKILRELGGLGLVFLGALLAISLGSYSPTDPSFNQSVSDAYAVTNQAGIIGAYMSGLLAELFGLAAWFFPLGALLGGLTLVMPWLRPVWFRWLGFSLLFVCCFSLAEQPWVRQHIQLGRISGGGAIGELVFRTATGYLKSTGAFVLWLFALLCGVQLCLRLSWSRLGDSFGRRISAVKSSLIDRMGGLRPRLAGLLPHRSEKEERPPVASAARTVQKTTSSGQQGQKSTAAAAKTGGKSKPKAPAADKAVSPAKPLEAASKAEYPPVELLHQVPAAQDQAKAGQTDELSEKLSNCLQEFGIQGEVVQASPGPVVTMFEFRPAPGIKISRIANLHDDLALALKATAVRIMAPIPGKDTVGIELPNRDRKTVFFREIIESKHFPGSKGGLPMALGQDIYGRARVEDLAKMPHLLVAGATGAGKSVCLNSIISSFLFHSSPEQTKLLLIDPKRIEMAAYAELPHLVHPVVTEMELAKTALDWAVYEMDKRYEAMARLGVRNIQGFNAKLEELATKDPDSVQDLKPLPYLVLIIDELADLMLTAGKEAEASIVRLAQLARAAGIHLILATQRPSVDVVTGLIKANFPARIAFQVSSKHDSRTILDGVGAQYLLGQGDMLFKSSAGRLERIHGAFISDEEISSVIEFWKNKADASAELDLQEWKKETGGSTGAQENGDDIPDDPLYGQAVEFVTEQGKASISMIQRQLRIGFNRAARFIEQMERDGVIGPQEGSKPRVVLKS